MWLTENLSAYLARLRELRLVERRLPVTVPSVRPRRAWIKNSNYRFSAQISRLAAANGHSLVDTSDMTPDALRDVVLNVKQYQAE